MWHRDLALLYTAERNPPLRMLAVGWLGFFTFRLGATPQRFQELLAQLCRRPPYATQSCGVHHCRLGCCLWNLMLDRPRFGGSAEIIVPGRDGKVYRAPTLISHYVRSHQYRPPREFVEAVLALDSPGGVLWEAIERLIGDFGPPSDAREVPTRITREKVGRICPGMASSDVRSILGDGRVVRSGECVEGSGGNRVRRTTAVHEWHEGSQSVRVTFENDQVQEVHQLGLE